MFGDSFQFINYVECSTSDKQITKNCLDANISAFPTFVFGDGSRLMGTTDLEVLSNKTGCALPQTSNKTPNVLPSLIIQKPKELVLNTNQLPSGYQLTMENATDKGITRYYTTTTTSDVNSIGIKLYTLNGLPDSSIFTNICGSGSIIAGPIIGDDAVSCKYSADTNYYTYNFYTRNILVEIYIFTNTLTDSQAIDYITSLATSQLVAINNISPPKIVISQQSIIFSTPDTLSVTAGEEFKYSFCNPEPTSQTSPCGPMPETTNPTGGNPPYHFQLGSGTGFPPFGLSLGKDGILRGTVDSRATPGSYQIEVCAVDLNGNAVCHTVTIIVTAAETPAPTTTESSIEFTSKSCPFGWEDSDGKRTDKASLTFKITGPVGAEANGGPCKQNPDCGSWHATNDNTCVRQNGDPESTTATYNYCTIDENRPNYYRGWIYVEGQGETMSSYYTCP